jgi:hypothetical protein
MKQARGFYGMGRCLLPHAFPHFIRMSDATFFVTICCQAKGVINFAILTRQKSFLMPRGTIVISITGAFRFSF